MTRYAGGYVLGAILVPHCDLIYSCLIMWIGLFAAGNEFSNRSHML